MEDRLLAGERLSFDDGVFLSEHADLSMLGTIMTAFTAMGGLLVWVARYERRALENAGYEHVLRNGVTQG